MVRSSIFELSWGFGVMALATLLLPNQAAACKCGATTVEQGIGNAVAVFEGRVVSIEEGLPGPGQAEGVKRITLALVRTWKGLENNERAFVTTNASSASCGYLFQPNTSYLVYATGSDTALEVSGCSRTRAMADAGEDLAALGAGVTPVEVKPEKAPTARPTAAPKAGGCGSVKGATRANAVWGLVPLASAAIGARRRKRTG